MVLYTYVMTNDSGFAPTVKDGLLTLACCMGGKNGGMRKSISKYFDEDGKPLKDMDVYIAGLCGKKLANGVVDRIYSPIFFARVTGVMPMNKYFSNSDYVNRADYKAYEVIGDSKLEPTKYNPHTGDAVERDKSGKFVIMSDNFTYFGSECGKDVKLNDLIKACPNSENSVFEYYKNPATARGYRIFIDPPYFDEIKKVCKLDKTGAKVLNPKNPFLSKKYADKDISEDETGCKSK